jgi:ethanolamine utilization protein EutA (predicted chaperonin)
MRGASANCLPDKPGEWSRSAPATLESVMAAYGSGAVARSIRNGAPVMNVDVGGGTAKIAICTEGKVTDVTALDVGARLVVIDEARRVQRLEEAGRRFAAALGLNLEPNAVLTEQHARREDGRQFVGSDARRLAAPGRRRLIAARSTELPWRKFRT